MSESDSFYVIVLNLSYLTLSVLHELLRAPVILYRHYESFCVIIIELLYYYRFKFAMSVRMCMYVLDMVPGLCHCVDCVYYFKIFIAWEYSTHKPMVYN